MLPLAQKVMLPLSLSQSMEAKRIVSENSGVFTFLVQHLDQKRPNAAAKRYASGP
jgi:hypothetical protein